MLYLLRYRPAESSGYPNCDSPGQDEYHHHDGDVEDSEKNTADVHFASSFGSTIHLASIARTSLCSSKINLTSLSRVSETLVIMSQKKPSKAKFIMTKAKLSGWLRMMSMKEPVIFPTSSTGPGFIMVTSYTVAGALLSMKS